MRNFFEHLQRPTSNVFKREELNEILLMTYNIIKRAVREGGDTLTLTSSRFTWSKDGVLLGERRIDRVKPSTSYRSQLELIVERDEIVRQHLIPITKTKKEVVYRIKLDDSER